MRVYIWGFLVWLVVNVVVTEEDASLHAGCMQGA